jgi:hypothetical protein
MPSHVAPICSRSLIFYFAVASKDTTRRTAARKPGSIASDSGWKRKDEEGGNNRKASLRVGNGRKGRGTENNQRRGSLKRRDRTAEKVAKAEMALERRSVNLPE